MNHEFWVKQGSEPLFPDMLWSRPENRAQAGKLLIVGGNVHGFTAPAAAYRAAEAAGIGTARVILPQSLEKTVSKVFPEASYAPSTSSGGFGQAALADIYDQAQWADGVLLAGDLGRNSETIVMVDTLLEKYEGTVVAVQDASDIITADPITALHRPHTTVICSLQQLQRLGTSAHFPRAFTSDMGLVKLVETLQEFTKRYTVNVVICHEGHCVVAANGRLSTTKTDRLDTRPVQTAASAATWLIQNPARPFEALTTSLTK